MKVRVGLMGFGRVGRNIFRILAKRDDIEVAAISDIADAKSLTYLLKYDSILGRFGGDVSVDEQGQATINGKKVQFLTGRDPGDVNWGEHKVDVVIEATGRARSRSDAQKHLDKGAKRVILCVPSLDADVTVVQGTNHKELTAKHKVIAVGSIAAHAALPVLKVLENKFGIERVYYTAVQAYTNDQRLADVPGEDLRRSRAAAQSIIPTATDSDQVLSKVLPAVDGKISGMALKVPVANGSLIDMVTFTKEPASVQAVNDAVRAACSGEYKNIVEFCTDEIVSSDVKQSPYSATFDSQATMAMAPNVVKTISWFDPWGYANRAVELVESLAKLEGGLS